MQEGSLFAQAVSEINSAGDFNQISLDCKANIDIGVQTGSNAARFTETERRPGEPWTSVHERAGLRGVLSCLA
jgi:hypothetical protein